MDKFEEHEIKKIRQIIGNWFDWLIKQSMMGKKPKIIRDKLEDKIINDIWRILILKKKKKTEKIIKDNRYQDTF